jgi:hypothetical protein
MKASYTVRPGLTVEVEGENQAKLFAELSSAAEVFGERCCGLCGSVEIVPIARHQGGFDFFEWACTDPACGARLSVGQKKGEERRLFPVRKLTAEGKPDFKAGQPGKHGGWTKYRGPAGERPDTDDDEPRAAAQPPAAQQAQAAATAVAAGTRTDPQSITREQWEEIKTALALHYIAPAAFLQRYGYAAPRQIPAAHFDEALAAARQPDDELRAAQKAGFGGKG